jgi:hypothetical protein
MVRNLMRGLLVLLAAVTLVACGVKPEINSRGPVQIVGVEASGNALPGQLEDLKQKTLQLAPRVPEGGDSVILQLQIADYHLKNPALSLLIGDSNRIVVDVQVVSQNSGTVLSHFKSTSSVDVFINGPVGAIMAAASDKDKVMSHLNSKAADDIFEHIYGSKVWKSLGRR